MNRKILITLFLLLTIVLILIFSAIYYKSIIELKIDEAKIDKNPNKKAELLFTTDKNYVNYMRVAIKSAIVNKNKDSFYNITVLGVDLPDNEIARIKQFQREDVKINVIPLTIDLIKDIAPNQTHQYISRADMFKYIYPEILKDINKVLYIDSDVIIQKDLLRLYNTDISNKYLGAVIYYDYTKFNIKSKKIIGYFYYHQHNIKDITYYNAGVMLLNLKKMREDGISKKFIAEQNKDKEDKMYSQDVYNKVIPVDKIKKLHPVNNFLIYQILLKNHYFLPEYRIKSIDEFIKEAVIIHYAAPEKPWHKRFGAPDDIWWKYAKMVDENWEVEKME